MKSQRLLPLFIRSFCVTSCLFTLLALFASQPLHAAAQDSAFVRIVHASPDIGTVDVFMDGAKLLSSFQYATATSYAPVAAGSHTLQVALIGKGINAAVITQTLTVAAGAAYTIAATGMKSTHLSLTIFTDDNTISGNEAKIRFYHFSPNVAAVNVATDSDITFQGVAYQNASDYAYVSPDTKALKVTVAPGNVTFPVSTTFKAWSVTSIFAIGILNGHPDLQFVFAQENGIPGMPKTGSDPTPLPQPGPWQPILPVGLVFAVSLLLVAARRRRYQQSRSHS